MDPSETNGVVNNDPFKEISLSWVATSITIQTQAMHPLLHPHRSSLVFNSINVQTE